MFTRPEFTEASLSLLAECGIDSKSMSLDQVITVINGLTDSVKTKQDTQTDGITPEVFAKFTSNIMTTIATNSNKQEVIKTVKEHAQAVLSGVCNCPDCTKKKDTKTEAKPAPKAKGKLDTELLKKDPSFNKFMDELFSSIGLDTTEETPTGKKSSAVHGEVSEEQANKAMQEMFDGYMQEVSGLARIDRGLKLAMYQQKISRFVNQIGDKVELETPNDIMILMIKELGRTPTVPEYTERALAMFESKLSQLN